MGEGIKRLLGSNSCIPSQLLEGFWVLVSFVPFLVHGFCFKDLPEAGLSLGSIKDLQDICLPSKKSRAVSCCKPASRCMSVASTRGHHQEKLVNSSGEGWLLNLETVEHVLVQTGSRAPLR